MKAVYVDKKKNITREKKNCRYVQNPTGRSHHLHASCWCSGASGGDHGRSGIRPPRHLCLYAIVHQDADPPVSYHQLADSSPLPLFFSAIFNFVPIQFTNSFLLRGRSPWSTSSQRSYSLRIYMLWFSIFVLQRAETNSCVAVLIEQNTNAMARFKCVDF